MVLLLSSRYRHRSRRIREHAFILLLLLLRKREKKRERDAHVSHRESKRRDTFSTERAHGEGKEVRRRKRFFVFPLVQEKRCSKVLLLFDKVVFVFVHLTKPKKHFRRKSNK